ncbi:MAG: hypothetical protein EBY66_05785, partial [Candidatus Fonsibacter lacus]|nr:hypothetical protein [Candidatus Fonsibacter lacus]
MPTCCVGCRSIQPHPTHCLTGDGAADFEGAVDDVAEGVVHVVIAGVLGRRAVLCVALQLQAFDQPLAARVNEQPALPGAVLEQGLHSGHPITHRWVGLRCHVADVVGLQDGHVAAAAVGAAGGAGGVGIAEDPGLGIAAADLLAQGVGVVGTGDLVKDVQLPAT